VAQPVVKVRLQQDGLRSLRLRSTSAPGRTFAVQVHSLCQQLQLRQ